VTFDPESYFNILNIYHYVNVNFVAQSDGSVQAKLIHSLDTPL